MIKTGKECRNFNCFDIRKFASFESSLLCSNRALRIYNRFVELNLYFANGLHLFNKNEIAYIPKWGISFVVMFSWWIHSDWIFRGGIFPAGFGHMPLQFTFHWKFPITKITKFYNRKTIANTLLVHLTFFISPHYSQVMHTDPGGKGKLQPKWEILLQISGVITNCSAIDEKY